MSIDTPAKIAILGAGPIGLEAALYARFLGYDVEIFERGEVADNVCRWGHVKLFSPFRMNASSLGLAAIQAQDENYVPPGGEELLTGRQWFDRYLWPLSQTDLIADHLRTQTTVVSVTRRDFLKPESPIEATRDDSPFRIVLRSRNRNEHESTAEVVIDTTGVFGNANWLGEGGAPALGELAVRDRIRYDIPDIDGQDQSRYANRRVLVIGAGHSAATSIVALARLAATYPDTQITWLIRRQLPRDTSLPSATVELPLREMANDPLTERARIVQAANATVATASGPVKLVTGLMIRSIAWDEERREFKVSYSGPEPVQGVFDEIIANIGYRPDNSIYSELQIHECYSSGGPMNLAAHLSGSKAGDCLSQTSHGSSSLMNPEPNFYILGAKSYGRTPHFLVSVGLQQIRELFQIIGGRETLNLYRN